MYNNNLYHCKDKPKKVLPADKNRNVFPSVIICQTVKDTYSGGTSSGRILQPPSPMCLTICWQTPKFKKLEEETGQCHWPQQIFIR